MHNKSYFEKFCDLATLTFTILLTCFLLLSLSCGGMSGADMTPKCSVPALEGPFTLLFALFFISSFAGIFWIWVPISGFVMKVRRVHEIGLKKFVQKYKWDTFAYFPIIFLILGLLFSALMSILIMFRLVL